MQKWEYLVITYTNQEGKSYVVSINGVSTFTPPQFPFDPPNAPEFFPYLTQLGEQGWELVDIGYSTQWVFKRLKP